MPPNKHFNPSAQHTKVQSYLDQLNVEVASILEENSGRLQEISRLQSELNAYKRAYGTIESEREKLEFEKNEIEKRNEDLEARLKGHRVVALIDGDGSIFNNDLLARGHLGGLQAAGHLSNHLTQYLTQNFGTHPYTLWVYVFLNKRGLMHLLMRQGQQDSAKKLEEFVVGFNQAAHRFSMVDVGRAKEGADTKIKTYLEDETVASQTFKVIFGGCHDNGYVANLRSHITSGFKDKLILLKGYNEMAFGFSELGLPIMTIPGLFVTEKIKNISNGERHPLPNFSLQREFDASSVTSSEEEKAPSRSSEYWQHSPEDVFYSTRSPATTLFDISRNDDIATDIESRLLETTATGPRRGRQVIPKLPLYKHKPAPCNLFYLVGNCKNGIACKYGHDYELNQKHIEEMKKNAKRSPCPAINRGGECEWGEANCYYSHICPALSKCYYLKQGKCKFVGASMHIDPADLD